MLHTEGERDVCERNMLYIFKVIFYLFLGTLGLTIFSRQFCVLLSRTVNIVIILMIFVAIITLFLNIQVFYPYFFRDQSSN